MNFTILAEFSLSSTMLNISFNDTFKGTFLIFFKKIYLHIRMRPRKLMFVAYSPIVISHLSHMLFMFDPIDVRRLSHDIVG